MTPLEISIGSLGRHILVRLTGEIDATNSEPLAANLISLLGQAAGSGGEGRRRRAVITQLAELGFCDARGLGSLIVAAAAANDRGVCFAVAEPALRIARLFALTGLDKAPWYFSDLAAALRAAERWPAYAPQAGRNLDV